MQNELKILEQKVNQLVQMNARNRAEISQLRQELAQTISQVRKNEDKIQAAAEQVEAILATLPEESI